MLGFPIHNSFCMEAMGFPTFWASVEGSGSNRKGFRELGLGFLLECFGGLPAGLWEVPGLDDYASTS